MNRPRVSFYTLGCRLNQAETGSLGNLFEKQGFHVVPFHESADTVVINTCTVTENGDDEARRLIAQVHRRQPDARIALVGCQVESGSDILAGLPGVRWLVGNERKMELAAILTENPAPLAPLLVKPVIRRQAFTVPGTSGNPRFTRATLKVQDGCDFFCSFCVIPFTRGRARSREWKDLLREAEALVGSGYQELVLSGINPGTYNDQGKTLLKVTRELLAIEGLKRLRISSIEPTTVEAGFLDLLRSEPRFCRYFHIPLQSASDALLGHMERRYTLDAYDGFLREILTANPDTCLGTDLIVGFPGETCDDFEQTRDYCLGSPLHYFHVFSYSDRPNAKSRALADKVPAATIYERSRVLRDLSRSKQHTFLRRFEGTECEVLFENRKNGLWSGLTDHYIRVRAASPHTLRNRLLPVRLEQTGDGWMSGTLL